MWVRVWRKGNPPILLLGMQVGAATMENSMEAPQGTIREGNGTPLQYSCLENPMDRGAWWAAVLGSLRVGYD